VKLPRKTSKKAEDEETRVVEAPPDADETAEDDASDWENGKPKRTELLQVKVMPRLKKRAEKRARSLDMDLSEYLRFLLARDLHGF
jgi:hypothetical protein